MIARFVGLSVLVVAWSAYFASGLAQEGARDAKKFSSDLDVGRRAKPEQVEAWRKRYQFESLTKRLEYERRFRADAIPSLSAVAEEQLEVAEKWSDYSNVRARSLEMLHTMEVEEFISKSGVGFERRLTPGALYIENPPSEPIELTKLPPLSTEEADVAAWPILKGEQGAVNPAILRLMPTRSDMSAFHAQGLSSFVNPWGLGWIKSVDRVAGFRLHDLSSLPQPPIDAAQKKTRSEEDSSEGTIEHKYWKVTRLELVSLLKHKTPRVYVSDHLPRMEELSSATAKTRELGKFEIGALAKLCDGEEVQTSSIPNRIEMLGAIRASRQCMQCHEVPRGTLLGAFSYELRRDPPIKIPTAEAQQ